MGARGQDPRLRDPDAIFDILRVPASDEPEAKSALARTRRALASRAITLGLAGGSKAARHWLDGSLSDVDLIYVWMQPYDSACAGVDCRGAWEALGRRPRRPLGARRDDGLPVSAASPPRPCDDGKAAAARPSAIVMSTPEAVGGCSRPSLSSPTRRSSRFRTASPQPTSRARSRAHGRHVPHRAYGLPAHRARAAAQRRASPGAACWREASRVSTSSRARTSTSRGAQPPARRRARARATCSRSTSPAC